MVAHRITSQLILWTIEVKPKLRANQNIYFFDKFLDTAQSSKRDT